MGGSHPSLTECDLCLNQLGDEGAQLVATALKESTTSKLQKLDMGNNHIGPTGTAALAAYVAASATLTELDLTGNELTSQGSDMSGVSALAEAMKANSSLREVALLWTELGDEGTEIIREAARGKEGLST